MPDFIKSPGAREIRGTDLGRIFCQADTARAQRVKRHPVAMVTGIVSERVMKEMCVKRGDNLYSGRCYPPYRMALSALYYRNSEDHVSILSETRELLAEERPALFVTSKTSVFLWVEMALPDS
ncbi:hypothetical protein RRG08_000644 [Elysia crispata]|uniref:Uncharacterized protein n=1 Tax=Elysia crispata TaxID=231223 RepID=A0AAE0Y8V4_9GAST|nr:hypothetical protein RRG08_000644 [Elysia crispata]